MNQRRALGPMLIVVIVLIAVVVALILLGRPAGEPAVAPGAGEVPVLAVLF